VWVLNLMNATKLEDLWAWRKYKEKAWGARSRRMSSKEQRQLRLLLPSPELLNTPPLKSLNRNWFFFNVWSGSDPSPHKNRTPGSSSQKSLFGTRGSVPPRFYNQASKLVPVSNWFLRPEPVPVWFQLTKISSKYLEPVRVKFRVPETRTAG
jgi:hypothetical protein